MGSFVAVSIISFRIAFYSGAFCTRHFKIVHAIKTFVSISEQIHLLTKVCKEKVHSIIDNLNIGFITNIKFIRSVYEIQTLH